MSIIINIKQISDISAVQSRVAEMVSAPTRDSLKAEVSLLRWIGEPRLINY